MKIAHMILFVAVAFGPTAHAADDRSPYDKNPACLDRNVDSSTGDCVIKDEGTPRHRYPPRAIQGGTTPSNPATVAPSGQPKSAPATTVRRSS